VLVVHESLEGDDDDVGDADGGISDRQGNARQDHQPEDGRDPEQRKTDPQTRLARHATDGVAGRRDLSAADRPDPLHSALERQLTRNRKADANEKQESGGKKPRMRWRIDR
jgi:hypothetical protein